GDHRVAVGGWLAAAHRVTASRSGSALAITRYGALREATLDGRTKATPTRTTAPAAACDAGVPEPRRAVLHEHCARRSRRRPGAPTAARTAAPSGHGALRPRALALVGPGQSRSARRAAPCRARSRGVRSA